jgi:hypothetical protein
MAAPQGGGKARRALRFALLLRHEGRMRLSVLLAVMVLWPASALAQTGQVADAVSAYALLQQDVTDLLDADIASAEALDLALERAARHDPARVSRGWIAYGALTAAQSPAFVEGVRGRVRAAGRAPVLRQLRRDLTYARRRPPGAAEAIQLVLSSSAADGARMIAGGHRYEGIGQMLDQGRWPTPASNDREGRHTRLRDSAGQTRTLAPELAARLNIAALAASPLTDANAVGGRRFWDAAAGRPSTTPPAFRWAPTRQATVDRMLTLSALIIVGATESEAARVNAMLDDETSSACLAMQQLQFRQCASVAHDPNEDAYCLARHGLTGAGQCFASIARAP